MTPRNYATGLLNALNESTYINGFDPTIVLRDVLLKLREQLSIDGYNWEDEKERLWSEGWDDCLKEIDNICTTLENYDH
jgi:hypothetical protein